MYAFLGYSEKWTVSHEMVFGEAISYILGMMKDLRNSRVLFNI